jgi:enamine deaminase RidA (YjgF/YER057c/UK114 family)
MLLEAVFLMTIQHIGIGPRASEAVIHNGVAHFAVTPERPYDGGLDAGEQTRQLLARLDAKLEKFGSSKSKVIFVTIVLADMAGNAAVNHEWDQWIDPNAPPSRACISAALASPAMKVEFIVQAAVDA